MRKYKYWLIPILCVLFAVLLLFTATGGVRTDVFLDSFDAGENCIVLNMGVAGSAGYLRTFSARQDGNRLYLTFYATYGINSRLGAKEAFSVDVDAACEEIYVYRGAEEGYACILQRDGASGWQRAT